MGLAADVLARLAADGATPAGGAWLGAAPAAARRPYLVIRLRTHRPEVYANSAVVEVVRVVARAIADDADSAKAAGALVAASLDRDEAVGTAGPPVLRRPGATTMVRRWDADAKHGWAWQAEWDCRTIRSA